MFAVAVLLLSGFGGFVCLFVFQIVLKISPSKTALGAHVQLVNESNSMYVLCLYLW